MATSHFHDVVISKEGHSECQHILLDIRYKGEICEIDQKDVFKACMIPMPVDQKRNMMNASSNFNIIYSILSAIQQKKKVKVHSPGVNGEIGGYPYIIDGTQKNVISYFDTTIFAMDEMRKANRKSIYLDGIDRVEDGNLYYTKELIEKVKEVFNWQLPVCVELEESNQLGQDIIDNIIVSNMIK